MNDASRDNYADFSTEQGAKGSELGQYFTDQKVSTADANTQATNETTIPQSGSDLTVREENKQKANATAFTDGQGQALGQLRAFGDLLGEKSIDQARSASLVGQLNGFKTGSSNVVPMELEAANQKGAGMKMFGDLLGLGGSLALNKGLGGSYTGASPTVSAVPTTFAAPVTPVTRGPLYNLYGTR